MDDFFSAISDALGAGLEAVMAAIIYIFQLLAAVAQFIWSAIQIIFGYQQGLFQDAYGFSNFTWGGFFKDIFNDILKGIVKFGQWLAQIFGPVVKWLKELSKHIDRIYNTYIRPILKWIRIARVFLSLLRALGIKWAAKLDSILGKIQSDIQRAFLTVKQYLNVMIDLLNILADPSNLLRRPTTLLSLRRIFHAFIRQVTGVPPGFFLPSPSKFAPPGLGFLPANFDPSDPLQNPPPSYYLAFDGGVQDFSFLGPGDTIDDGAVDDVSALDYFSPDAYPGPDCIDIANCRDDLVSASQGALAGG